MRNIKPTFILMALEKELREHDWTFNMSDDQRYWRAGTDQQKRIKAMVDDAYFQIGNCSMALGNLEEAEVFFNEIITNHKKSPFAKDAKSKLSEVKKRLKAERRQG